MVEHLESGSCKKGWTIQHVNHIAAEKLTPYQYLHSSVLPWFLAGPPRDFVVPKDHVDPFWQCPLCRTMHLSHAGLQEHLQEEIRQSPYPELLQCLHCPSGFDRLSHLLEHIDIHGTGSCRDASFLAAVTEHLSNQVMENAGVARPLRVIHQLRVDPGKERELMVNVCRNLTTIPKGTM